MPLPLPRLRRRSELLLALASAALLSGAFPQPSAADDGPVVVEGRAAAAHPAGRAILEAAKLVAAGKLGDVRSKSNKEVRDEWATLSAAEKSDETERAKAKAPDPATFEAEIAKSGILTIYGDSATLRIETASGDPSAMAFVSLEDGKWKVTGGPMKFDPPPVETAPAIAGEAILQHEIGKLALDYAKRLESGSIDRALELFSTALREHRAAMPPAEQKESDKFRRDQLPPAAQLAAQIRSGGNLSFFGEKAYLNISSSSSTANPDGSTTFSSSSTALGFSLEKGRWKIGD